MKVVKGPARIRALAVPFLLALLVCSSLYCLSCRGRETSPSGGEGGDGLPRDKGDGGNGARFTFLLCGDPHSRTDLLRGIVDQAREGEFLVILGDISTGKGLEEMEGMKRFLDSTGITYYAIPGDNDMPRGDASVFRQVFGPDYYSLEVNGCHLVFLNDAVIGTGCPQEELEWLEKDLKGVGERLGIAFAHVPPGAPVDIASGGFSARETESNQRMKELLASAGAQVIYCGHIHAYMVYSFGPPRVVVTGGAGAKPHLSAESGGFHHFLRVTVEGGRVSEEVIPL